MNKVRVLPLEFIWLLWLQKTIIILDTFIQNKAFTEKNSLKSKEETKIIKNLLNDIKKDDVIEVKLNKRKDKICYASDDKEIFK